MRLAYVTAHYPPDFTSGATLQVERLARRAVELGHEVQVFSGAIRQGLADGELRTETVDGAGVHWIGTSGRVEQGDDGNWDNPLAATAVADWLQEFGPDVIHMHTLQTLGVGVVEAAANSGSRTVVTMHDLWWWCSRLFLVDVDLEPCPLVTDVGTCACARTAAWRAERAARLTQVLGRVDLILVPSSTLRDVVIANGVPPERVEVDENDLATTVIPLEVGADVDDNGPVHFLYLGGDSPLKGADVIRAAAHELAGVGGWTLDAFGLSPGHLPDQVRATPAFAPDDLMSVLGRADVLVIPSIARESFSIAAREALVAGLAVITSDCLGPEEVVRDGINGLVTPTGDAPALADAMRTLVDDPETLRRLRHHVASEPVTIRSTADHVDALVERYRTLAPLPAATGPRNVAFVVGADGSIARYRVHHQREALELDGATCRVAHYLDPTIDRIADGMDVVVLQRVPATSHLLELVDEWRTRGVLVVFDVDDLIFDPELVDEIPGLAALSIDEQRAYLDGLHRYRTTLDHCDGAIVPTPALADHVRATIGLPVAVVGNGLGLVELRSAVELRRVRRERGDDRVRIAYLSGSDSHQPDLDMIAPAVATVMERRSNVEFLVVGPITAGPELEVFTDRVMSQPFRPWRSLFELLVDVDVNVAPLALPSRFNECKSAVKWLEAAAVGVATVASPSGPFADAIEHGRTGMLCRTQADWVESLTVLVDDASRRRRIGAAARRRSELAHGPHITAFAYRDALDWLSANRPTGRNARWPAAAPDERAPSAPPLDAYDVEVDHVDRRRWFRRLVRR